MNTDFLPRHIEALIFCAPQPLKLGEIQSCLAEMFDASLESHTVEEAIQQLKERYQDESYAFELLEVGGGYQFMTKPAYQESIALLLKQQSKKRQIGRAHV